MSQNADHGPAMPPAGDGGPGSASPRGSADPLCEAYDVGLLDLDGVVYLGGAAIPGAGQALAEARKRGMRLAFVTNNASRTPSAIAAQLDGLGVPASRSDIVTSAQAAARLIADRVPKGAPVLVCGGIGLRLALRERGLRPVSTALDRPAAVAQGYAADVTYSLLAEAAIAVRAGALFVASNADATLPTRRGPQPGNGSLVQVVVTATGVRPVVAGKPEPPLQAESVARTGARRPLVVGDRLDTDIEGACRVGADSMLVLTGVSRPVDAVLAPSGRRPTYLARDVGGLLVPHPEVTREGDSFRCGGWTARRAGGGRTGPGSGPDADHGALELSGSGDPLDGLRALCAAAWSGGGVVSDEAAAAAVTAAGLPS
jgi:glycerol-1-phosphatase